MQNIVNGFVNRSALHHECPCGCIIVHNDLHDVRQQLLLALCTLRQFALYWVFINPHPDLILVVDLDHGGRNPHETIIGGKPSKTLQNGEGEGQRDIVTFGQRVSLLRVNVVAGLLLATSIFEGGLEVQHLDYKVMVFLHPFPEDRLLVFAQTD